MSLLPPDKFVSACSALPLISIDWVVTNSRREMLLGLRNNAPARGWWFTPGGRIRKNEALAAAKQRIALDELGLPAALLYSARLMGAWDHFYSDSAFDPDVSTHYVNLPHWLAIRDDNAASLTLPAGMTEQHGRWQWLPLDRAAKDETVHPYVRVYAEWLLSNVHF